MNQTAEMTRPTSLKDLNLQPKLRAERIQTKLRAERIQEKLRAERIQELAASLPGWRVGPCEDCLERQFTLPSVRAASLMGALIAAMGEAVGYVPDLMQQQTELVVTVSTDPEGGLSELDVDLAHYFEHRLFALDLERGGTGE